MTWQWFLIESTSLHDLRQLHVVLHWHPFSIMNTFIYMVLYYVIITSQIDYIHISLLMNSGLVSRWCLKRHGLAFLLLLRPVGRRGGNVSKRAPVSSLYERSGLTTERATRRKINHVMLCAALFVVINPQPLSTQGATTLRTYVWQLMWNTFSSIIMCHWLTDCINPSHHWFQDLQLAIEHMVGA